MGFAGFGFLIFTPIRKWMLWHTRCIMGFRGPTYRRGKPETLSLQAGQGAAARGAFGGSCRLPQRFSHPKCRRRRSGLGCAGSVRDVGTIWDQWMDDNMYISVGCMFMALK